MSKKLKDFMLEWGTEMHPSLTKYLKSKGLDPRYVSRNQMISHAKTGDFNKWKQDHYNKARLTHGMESVDVEELDVIEEEDKFQDPKAATQTVGMEIESNGKPLSNSTKRIKDIVTYGKKPKFISTDEKSSFGSNKPKALALVTGGTKVVQNAETCTSVTYSAAGQWTWFALPAACDARAYWCETALSRGSMGNPTNKYPDTCNMPISTAIWGGPVSYNIYMSGTVGNVNTIAFSCNLLP